MECGRFRELMMASLDGEICEADRAELESHLETCAECRREFDELRRVVGAVIWVAYGVYLFLTDPTIGSVTKFLVALPVVGLLMLLVSVIRERIAIGRTERYKEVER